MLILLEVDFHLLVVGLIVISYLAKNIIHYDICYLLLFLLERMRDLNSSLNLWPSVHISVHSCSLAELIIVFHELFTCFFIQR